MEDLASDRATLELNALKPKKEEKFEIATNFKKLETPIDIIVQATGLTKEEIKEL